MLKKTTEQFISDAISVHGDKYSYRLVSYKGSYIKVKILCPTHGYFYQSPTNHLSKKGCPVCGGLIPERNTKNKIMNDVGVCIIPLASGGSALIDEDDFDLVSSHNWFLSNGYPATCISGKIITLHRFLLCPKNKEQVDHINMIKNDCRRINLRICNQRQNIHNRPGIKNTSSIFKGVTLIKTTMTWRASLTTNGKTFYLGKYKKEEDAAKAYDKKAIEIHGEFARTNFKLT